MLALDIPLSLLAISQPHYATPMANYATPTAVMITPHNMH